MNSSGLDFAGATQRLAVGLSVLHVLVMADFSSGLGSDSGPRRGPKAVG